MGSTQQSGQEQVAKIAASRAGASPTAKAKFGEAAAGLLGLQVTDIQIELCPKDNRFDGKWGPNTQSALERWRFEAITSGRHCGPPNDDNECIISFYGSPLSELERTELLKEAKGKRAIDCSKNSDERQ